MPMPEHEPTWQTRLSSILQTLVPHVAAIPARHTHPTPEEIERLYETHGDLVPPEIYNALLTYINSNTTEHFITVPTYLTPVVPSPKSQSSTSRFTHLTRLFGPRSLNPGNSCISFLDLIWHSREAGKSLAFGLTFLTVSCVSF
jgi:hypothetical protein